MIDGQGVVYLRLALESSSEVNFDGVYIDDLSVACLDRPNSSYEAISGASMAAPRMAGVAALTGAESCADDCGAQEPAPFGCGRAAAARRIGFDWWAVERVPERWSECVPGSPPPVDPPPPPVDRLRRRWTPPPPPVEPASAADATCCAAPPPFRASPVAAASFPTSRAGRCRQPASRSRPLRCLLGRVGVPTRAGSRSRIIGQSERAGSRHPRGTRVNVVVSRGRRR